MQVTRHFLRAGIAGRCDRVGGAADDVIEARVAANDRRCRARIVGWKLAGEQLVEQHPDRENIRPEIHRMG